LTTVVDTNVVAALMLPTAANADVAELLRQDSDWRLPPLWRSEFRQVLLKVVRAEATGRWAPGSCAGHRYGLLHVRRRIRRTGTAAQLHAADLRSQVAAAFSGSCQKTRPIGSAPQRHHRAIQDCAEGSTAFLSIQFIPVR
jgi:predicted nucleic acid-binding protein